MSTSARAGRRPSVIPARVRLLRWLADRWVMASALLVLAYLFLPVAYTFVFSFNNYTKSNITWNPVGSPTLAHWQNPCGAPGVCESLVTSLQVGALSTRSWRRCSAR